MYKRQGQYKGSHARKKAQREENTAKKFHAGDKDGRLGRVWQVQTHKKIGYVRQIVEFSPAALDQLPAPIQPDEKQKGRLEMVHEVKEAIVQLLDSIV